MAEAPLVLVIESEEKTSPNSLFQRAQLALAEDATVVSTVEKGHGQYPIDAARPMLGDFVFRSAIVNLDSLRSQGGRTRTAEEIAKGILSLMPQNLSTLFLLSSQDKGFSDEVIRDAQILAQRDEEEPLAISNLKALDPSEDLRSVLSFDLFLDNFFAQFKSSSVTRFLPPLDPFLVSLSFRAFGYSEFSARLVATLMALALLISTFFIARQLFTSKVALLSAVVLFSSPLFCLQGRFVSNALLPSLLLFLHGYSVYKTTTTARPLWRIIVETMILGLLCYLAYGMLGVALWASIAIACPLFASDAAKKQAILLLALGLAGLAILACLTFLPDHAFFRQFRFTMAQFSGGLRSDAKTFDFALKELGFGFFPWSALLPVALAQILSNRLSLAHTMVVILFTSCFVGLMVAITPFNHTLFLGAPAVAILVALFLSQSEQQTSNRLVAFFGFGWFIVMWKDLAMSAEPIVSFLTTDPMFSIPGKGDMPFPEDARFPLVALVFSLLAGLLVLVFGGRLVSNARQAPAFFKNPRYFKITIFALIAVIIVDISIFVGLKWFALQGPDSSAPILLRIFLTGPDIVFLYLCILVVLALRYYDTVRAVVRRFVPSFIRSTTSTFFEALEQAKGASIFLCILGTFSALAITFDLFPTLSFHLSQKHIIKTYEVSKKKAQGILMKFGFKGQSGSNFYTTSLPEIQSQNDLVAKLAEKTSRTFVIVPKNEFSDINAQFRQRSQGRHIYVLDDRSSRFILLASSLAEGEEDRNWIRRALISQSEFDSLQDVNKTYVNFEDKIELIGYTLEKKAASRGSKVRITMFFRCKAKVPTSNRVFMHIDRVGSSARIHGEHFVLNLARETEETKTCTGCFATNHWMPGDIVVDEYDIQVPLGAPSGPHNIWVGFYNTGSEQRLQIKDFDKSKVTNDGQNRANIGILVVE
jgi:4-amino-4-deoxy-L-arabinose transferase-like glycosyltransferase